MKRPESKLIYEMMKTSLDDARFNILCADKHLKTSRYKTAATHCAISARVLRDLRADVATDEVLPTRQRNFLLRGIEQLYKELWRLASRIRRRAGLTKSVAELLEALVVPKDFPGAVRVAEA